MTNPWLYVDLTVFIVVVLLTGVLIPQILLIAFRKNLLDAPDPRKIHIVAVPRLGGIAFFPATLFTLALAFGVFRSYFPGLLADISSGSVTCLCYLICAVVTLYLVGMADDLIGLKYRAKFVAQILSALLVILGGLHIDDLHGFLFVHRMPLAVSILLTIPLTVFITNAINLIDGIDGLASGLSAVAFGFYGFIFYGSGLYVYSMIAFGTLGALVPFFYYNVFGNAERHGKIFMGDTGALTIGLLLSVMSIRICDIPDTTLGVNPAVTAFAPLLIPCCDVVRVYIERLRAHRNPFLPDKRHIHHKLLALGMSQRVAMPAIVLSSLLLILVNILLSHWVDITLLLCLDVAVWVTVNLDLSRRIRHRQQQTAL